MQRENINRQGNQIGGLQIASLTDVPEIDLATRIFGLTWAVCEDFGPEAGTFACKSTYSV